MSETLRLELVRLEDAIWRLSYKDRWDPADYAADARWRSRAAELRKQLKPLPPGPAGMAAGTAAHEVAQMGYDPIKAAEALPDLLAWIERATDGEPGVDYLNGDGRPIEENGWTDLDAIIARIKDRPDV